MHSIINYVEEGTLRSYYNHENYHGTSSMPVCYLETGMFDIVRREHHVIKIPTIMLRTLIGELASVCN